MLYSIKMFSKSNIIIRNLKTFSSALNNNRSFIINCRSYPLRLCCNRQIRDINVKRCFSKESSNKPVVNHVFIVIGGVALGAVGAYTYSTFINKSNKLTVAEPEDELEFDVPFVYENLEEDLKLLNEFGPVPYLLIGAGCASFAAFRAIRIQNPTAKVLMIGEEPFFPYMRPPLSKEMWFDKKSDVAETLTFTQWSGRERSIFYEPQDYYFSVKELLENKNGGVSVIRGKKVVKIDPVSQLVVLDTGEEIKYEKCLLATGARPQNLPVFEEAEDAIKKQVTLFRSARDFQKLDKISRKVKSIVIVGGGFLGSELACGLAKRSTSTGLLNVTQVFPESGNIGKVLPEYLSKWTSNKLEGEGVKVVPNVTIKAVSKKDKMIELQLSSDEIIVADHVIVAVGAEPNTVMAQSSGLEIDEKYGGFLVNAEMEARKNLWIAGDVSCFYDVKLGRRRVEHYDHAVVSGRLAGENMAGGGKPYLHQSMFWSDLGPHIGFEAIGIVDSTLPTVGVFAKSTESDSSKPVDVTGDNIRTETEEQSTVKPVSIEGKVPRAPDSSDNYGKGVIFYLRDNIIVGLVMWNVFSKMSVARKIINESKSYDDLAEVAKLFELHSTEIEE